MINEAEPVSRVQIQAPRWVFFYTTDINGIQGSLAFSSEKNSFEVICTQIMPEKADTRRPQCGFHMWDLVNIGFVLEALLVGLVGKPMVLELGRHTAFTPFPWWWPGAKSLAEILSDRREHNTKPRWCSSMCREMHCLRLPPHNIDTCTYQCRWIWYQYVFNVIIVMIMNVLSASKDALEVILVSQSRDSLPHSLSRLVQVVQSWQAACKDFFHFWGLKLWGIPGIRSMGPSVSYC